MSADGTVARAPRLLVRRKGPKPHRVTHRAKTTPTGSSKTGTWTSLTIHLKRPLDQRPFPDMRRQSIGRRNTGASIRADHAAQPVIDEVVPAELGLARRAILPLVSDTATLVFERTLALRAFLARRETANTRQTRMAFSDPESQRLPV